MNACKQCRYLREEEWCSNSKSPKFRYALGMSHQRYVHVSDTCSAFETRVRKGRATWIKNLWLKVSIFVVRGFRKFLDRIGL